MLIRLLAEEVAAAWDRVAPAILDALPPVTDDTSRIAVNLLRSILADRLQCWQATSELGELQSLITTTVVDDPIVNGRYLLIYSFYGFGNAMNRRDWEEGLTVLKNYARSQGCFSMIAYVANPQFVELLKTYGGDDSFTTVILPV